MAAQLPHLPDVQKLSKNVIRILGGNPSKFTLQGTNTYLLGSGSQRILLDTAQGFPSWSKNLETTLKSENATISTCLLSHWHMDHVGGIKDLFRICPDSALYKNQPTLDPDGVLHRYKTTNIADGDAFSTTNGDEKFEIKAIHTPGHTKDHMCFLIADSSEEGEIGALFTADNVLGHGTAVFEDLAIYLSSLEVMRKAIHEGECAYPGHGEVIPDGRGKIEFYIQHRRTREEEVLAVLRYGRTTKPAEGEMMGKELVAKEWGSMEMVKIIYADVPENLHEPAERGLLMVLEKLKAEGKVKRTDGWKWRIGEKAFL